MSKDMLKEIFRLQEKFDQAVVEHRGFGVSARGVDSEGNFGTHFRTGGSSR